MRKIKYIFLIIPVLLLTVSCRSKKTGDPVISTPVDLKEIVKADTLRIATMYGSTSYFMFRDEMMGFDYDMAQNLANYLHLNLKISIAQTEKDNAALGYIAALHSYWSNYYQLRRLTHYDFLNNRRIELEDVSAD